MKAIGIDIGTTTVCGIVMDAESGCVLSVQTLENDAAVKENITEFEQLQNPGRIQKLVLKIYHTFLSQYSDICSIGLTGQMHGILYTDQQGEAVSPLYTWQDERGNQEAADGQTYAQQLSALTGYPMATGFGLTTHYYNLKNGLVPSGAVQLCTIQDYMGMKLTGRKEPLMTVSDGASLGCFDLDSLCFDPEALAKAQIPRSILPACESGCVLLGKTPEGIPVSAGIGDNQASVIGSVKDIQHSVLVNVGTGSQISTGIDHYIRTQHVELRPLTGKKYILAGSGLCGGRAYAALECFLRQSIETMTGEDPGALYDKMSALLDRRGSRPSSLRIDTRFCGTRENPECTGSIQNLTLENFTPGEFIFSVLCGMAEELISYHKIMCQLGVKQPLHLIGSGNGIRLNVHLRKIFESAFQMDMKIPVHKEEAAYGAALFSLTATGIFSSLEEAQKLIQYMV